MSRGLLRGCSQVVLFLLAGFLILALGNDWVVVWDGHEIPAVYAGCFLAVVGIAGLFGVNIWSGGILDPEDDRGGSGRVKMPEGPKRSTNYWGLLYFGLFAVLAGVCGWFILTAPNQFKGSFAKLSVPDGWRAEELETGKIELTLYKVERESPTRIKLINLTEQAKKPHKPIVSEKNQKLLSDEREDQVAGHPATTYRFESAPSPYSKRDYTLGGYVTRVHCVPPVELFYSTNERHVEEHLADFEKVKESIVLPRVKNGKE